MGERSKKVKRMAIKTETLKKCRKNKKRIKRPRIVFHEDLGEYERIMSITLPTEEAKIDESLLPKEANPNLFWIMRSPMKIVFYLDTQKCFAYDNQGIYICTLEKHDLRKLFWRIGVLLKALKEKKIPQKVEENSKNEQKTSQN